MYPTTWTINRTFSKSEILAESLFNHPKKKENIVKMKLDAAASHCRAEQRKNHENGFVYEGRGSLNGFL